MMVHIKTAVGSHAPSLLSISLGIHPYSKEELQRQEIGQLPALADFCRLTRHADDYRFSAVTFIRRGKWLKTPKIIM